jgi:hypothetical protein
MIQPPDARTNGFLVFNGEKYRAFGGEFTPILIKRIA